ncbi:MAG TPA: hypothetical protein DCX27_14510 [Balneola sp.]|nr:hypothetical protein [Balneola sp.]
MKNTQISSPIETSAFGRASLRNAIENLEKHQGIESNLSLLKKTFRQVFGFLSVLDVNPKAAQLLANFVQSYRKTKSYPLTYKGFRSWTKTQKEKEREIKLLNRFKREVNGVFAAYTLLCRIQHDLDKTK